MEPIQVSARANMRILLKSDAQNLDEIVVVAYGTSTKGTFTGSAGVVMSDKLELRQVSDVSNALAGAVAGVQILNYIAQTSSSSLPAGNYRVSFKTKGRGDSKWQPVRKPGGNPYCFFSIGKDGVVSVDNDNSFTAIHPVIADTPASPSSLRFTLGGSNASDSYRGIVVGKGKKYVRCE